jgi:hypothetical protein
MVAALVYLLPPRREISPKIIIINKGGINMKRIITVAAAVVSTLTLGAGVVGAQSIDHSGPDSSNHTSWSSTVDHKMTNATNVSATNNNPQMAHSGNAKSEDSTTGGGATTGSAANMSGLVGEVTTSNPAGSGMGASSAVAADVSDGGNITSSGPDSHNSVVTKSSVKTQVANTTNVNLVNNNSQSAVTGNATVSENTSGGNAMSGNAMNTSTTSFTVNTTN